MTRKNRTTIVDGTYYRDDGHGPMVYKDDPDEAPGGGLLGGLVAIVVGFLLVLSAIRALWGWFIGLF